MRNKCAGLLLLCLMPMTAIAETPVIITEGWARATAPGQEVGAAYMNLQSAKDTVLVDVSSPAADAIEIHEMSMDKGVMKMRMMETLPLPAGKLVKLAPGGFHLMLFDLKKPLKTGGSIKLRLSFKDKQGKKTAQTVQLPVKALQD